MMDKPIYVTRPQLPPLHEFINELERMWESRVLTNGGPFHDKFERALCAFLGVPYVSLINNGTIALIVALRALDIDGEVITTPFSFVATAHSIKWAGCEPVFADIDERTLNLDPERLEAAITPRTSAILPVHCYGLPCNTEAIQKIADIHKLRVVYDAAHAFGVNVAGRSLLNCGDLSVLSFHATKVFNTFEGGAIVSHTEAMKARIDRLKNFGFGDDGTISEVGLNGKMSEVNAICGLLQLRHYDDAIRGRKRVDRYYREKLARVRGIRCLGEGGDDLSNSSYFPILVEDEYPLSRDVLFQRFLSNNIHVRRYFNPLISSFAAYSKVTSAAPGNLPIATYAAQRILCLPIYPTLESVELDAVISVLEGKS